MRVELAWVAENGEVRLVAIQLPPGATLGEALAAIEEPPLRQALAAGRLAAAVFGKLRRPEEPLVEGDRIELLAPLRIDPKTARQRRVSVRREQAARAKQAAASRRGGKDPTSETNS